MNPEHSYADPAAAVQPVSSFPVPFISRRGLLAVGVGGVGMLALAACANGSGTSEGGGNGSETDGSSGGGTGSSPSSTNGANSGSGETTLTALADVEVGAAKAVTLPNGAPAVVARPTTATAVCFSAVCTHQGCTVAPSGAKLVCPCHGSEFNALTGAVLQGPAASPLPKVAVKVQAGKVVTA